MAAANVVSLQGPAVLEALAGDRLEAMGGHANQYATGAVAHLLRPLEPVAAAGGWWCSGLDPLADWAPMAWGCFRPDAPRWDHQRNRPRKYEHPNGPAARLFWLRVPATIAAKIADRHRLRLPLEVAADADGSAGAFWRWWSQTTALPLVITEGAIKAGALVSAGLPAVAAPGIWNPSRKGADGRPALLPELAAVPLAHRPVWVLFDHNPSPDAAEPLAAGRLGRLLAAAGAAVLVGTCPGPHKGADDALAAGVPWEALAAQLKPLAPPPVLPRLRRPDRIAPAGRHLLEAIGHLPTADEAPLVALAMPMGAGKSYAIRAAVEPLLAAGRRVVLITHRKSLGMALAADLGLPWADEAAPGRDLRQQGIALCIDSLCPSSRLRINPDDWRGAVVVIDEAVAVLRSALMGRTAIARRRTAVLATLALLLRQASQVLAADAQLDDPTLQALEAAADRQALLIGSAHLPAAGRSLTVHPTRDSWRAQLVALLQARRPLWIATTAAEGTSANSAQNLAIVAAEHWPGCRVLVVDGETIHDASHDAHRLAHNPDAIASAYDVVIATPAVEAGLSVTLRGHFAAVMVCSGGTTDPASIAQAAARVRDDCPRHLYAPDASPGKHLRIGSGSTDPAAVLQRLKEHEQIAIGQLAAAGWQAASNDSGPWLRLWAQQAAYQNAARLAFCSTVVALLQREGYTASDAAPLDAIGRAIAETTGARLADLAEMEQNAQRDRIISAEPLTDQQAHDLQTCRRRLNPAERAQLQRWRIARAWGLGQAAPTAAILEAHEQDTHRRVVFRWAITDPAATPLITAHDRQQAQQIAPDGQPWAPDLCRDLWGPRVTAAQLLGLPAWLQRSDWFTADDPALLELQAITTANAASICQVLGIKPGKRGTTVLRQLLELAAYRLEAQQIRSGPDRGRWRYRVTPEPLPAGIKADQIVAGWRDGTKNPLQ